MCNINITKENIMNVRCIEYCPRTIVSAVEELKSESDDKKFSFATRLAIQASDLLQRFDKEDLIWPDFKEGNILLRENGSIVVPDTRFIVPLDKVYLFKDTKNKKEILHVDNFATTENLASSTVMERCFDKPVPSDQKPLDAANTVRKQLKEEWVKENRYQFGGFMYYSLTGENKDPNEPIKIDHPIFQSDMGKKFLDMITKLTHEDPDQRMKLEDATKLLTSNEFKTKSELKNLGLLSVKFDEKSIPSNNKDTKKITDESGQAAAFKSKGSQPPEISREKRSQIIRNPNPIHTDPEKAREVKQQAAKDKDINVTESFKLKH
jgi:serine/threonine protein kinase